MQPCVLNQLSFSGNLGLYSKLSELSKLIKVTQSNRAWLFFFFFRTTPTLRVGLNGNNFRKAYY